MAAALLLGGSDSRLLDGRALAGAVTAEPEEQWSWRPDGPTAGAAAVGDVLVVGSDDQDGVTALDEDGDVLWTSDVGGYAYSLPEHDDLVFVTSYEGEDVVVLSVDDGEELWSVDGGYLTGSGDDGLFYTDVDEEEVGLLDAGTGDESWSVDGVDGHAVTDDAVYVLDGGELSRLEAGSGDEEWSVQTGVDAGDDSYVSITATRDLVVLGDDDVVAFDAGDGEELWSESGFEDGVEVGVYAADRVYLATTDYDEDEPSVDATVYDREGAVGDLDLDRGDYFAPLTFEMNGTPYVYDYSSGRVFDEDLEEIGRYDGTVTFVDGGLYSLEEDGEVSYYELGSSSSAWSIDTGFAVDEEFYGSVVALDERLVVVAEDQVVSYR